MSRLGFLSFAGFKLQAAGVQHAIAWPDAPCIPAVVASQFSHTFFCGLLLMQAAVHESFALANHVVQAHCTVFADHQYIAPTLPSLFSHTKAVLPDNSSIPPPSIPGIDSSVGLAAAVPGGFCQASLH